MRRFAAVALFVGCLLLVAGVCLADSLDLTPSPQTIEDLKTLPDGTHVSLALEDIVRISKGSTKYVVIQETLTNDRLSLLAAPHPLLRLTQVIDCAGDLITLPSGDRALVNVTIWGYVTESGELLYHPAPIKGLSPSWDLPWPKIDLTVDPSSSDGAGTQGLSRSDSQNGALDYTPPADDTDTSTPQPTPYDTIDSVVDADPPLTAGSLVAFESKTIVDAGVEDGTGFSYLDIIDDPAGMTSLRVYYDPNVFLTAAGASYINYVSGQLQDNGSGTLVLDCNSGPSYDCQAFVGILQPVGLVELTTGSPIDTIASVLAKPNGSSVNITNPTGGPDNGKIVVATNSDFPGYIYIMEPSRSNGIRVNYTDTAGAISRGSKVLITGTVSTGADGEREIEAGTSGVSIDTASPTAPLPNPLGISNVLLGGQLNGTSITSITTPPSVGCYNRGLLVRAWGQVTYVDTTNGCFYVYDGGHLGDGSWVDDGTHSPSVYGVKVDYGWPTGKTPIVPPQVGWYVSVVGISGSERPSANHYIRVLRPRHPRDIIAYNTGDTSSPAIAITTPSDGQLHLAQNQSTVQLAGTASDPDTGVSCVEVTVVAQGASEPAHPWPCATYNASSQHWTYNWSGVHAGNYTIYASATDFAGHTTEVNRTVTVTTSIQVVYVSPNGDNSKSGLSWALAKKTVTAGMSAASIDQEVWVAQGTYSELITLKSRVGLYGGFNGVETAREQRNWATNRTIFDGNQAGPVVTFPSGSSATAIDGFVIQNGSATNNSGNGGGGVYCLNATATIANNVIRGNNSGSAAGSMGGGLMASGSTLTVVGNVFVGNTAVDGAGICCSTTGGQIANNTIIGNFASIDGGGVWLSGSPTCSNNIVAANVGGGIYLSSGSPTLVRNDVYGNNGNGKYEYSWTTTYPVGTDLVPSDPVIPNIGWGDWHIAGTSPCHDPQGTSLAVPIDRDMDGESRVYGSTVDIGADEWHGADPGLVTTIYVKPSSQGGSDSNNGTSWGTAVASVQKGIDLANSACGGEVWVAAGSYSTAKLKSFVKLYGGFAVGDTTKSTRNWKTNQTILDARASDAVVTISNAVGCAVDGFIIRDGCGHYVNYGSGYGVYGGGIYCLSTIATIANNVIRANNTVCYWSNCGGGLYSSNSFLTVDGNVFVDNVARGGGGIYWSGTGGQIANNTIICNAASDSSGYLYDGGGLYLASGSPALSNNIIAFNSGGGIYEYHTSWSTYSGSPTFTKDDVYGNSGSGKYDYSWTTSYPVGTDLVPVDPVIPYASWGDWHIAGNSLCHDQQGTTLAVPMDKDIDAEGRVYGSTVDIGADEWHSNPIQISPSRVGFMYDICVPGDTIEPYLQREWIVHPFEIAYSRIDASQSNWWNNYDVVFVELPDDMTITQSVIDALNSFVASGRKKRVVLVGEYDGLVSYADYNTNLNTLAAGLGMHSMFMGGGTCYDNGPSLTRICTVAQSHYLMAGVSSIWDSATDYFVATGENAWSLWARPLAYINESTASAQPFIIEEDTAAAGSRIAIHDASIFSIDPSDPTQCYDDTNDTVPDKNFQFIYNLCTKFPQ